MRFLQVCIASDLVIKNTMFPHKSIHRFMRTEASRNERSIIDYIIVRKCVIHQPNRTIYTRHKGEKSQIWFAKPREQRGRTSVTILNKIMNRTIHYSLEL